MVVHALILPYPLSCFAATFEMIKMKQNNYNFFVMFIINARHLLKF